MKGLFFLLLIFIFTTSCTSTKVIVVEESKVEEVAEIGPQLIFVSYKFNGKELTLINKIITAGKLKGKTSQGFETKEGDLIFKQLNMNKELLSEQKIPNPRVRIVEYVDENGVFQKKSIDIENPEFTMRVDLNPQTRYLAIIEIQGDNSNSILNLSEI